MKKFIRVLAIASVSLSTTAFAMPAAVPQIYYDQMSHREAAWANGGFCKSPIGAMSPFCAFHADL